MNTHASSETRQSPSPLRCSRIICIRSKRPKPSTVQLFKAIQICRRVAIRPKLRVRRFWPKPKDYPENPTTLREHLLRRRKQLGLFQRQAAEQAGVSHEAYITWEKRGRSPEIKHWPGIIRLLGYDPHGTPETLGDRIASYRRRTGMTHRQLAGLIGVHECTVQSWEAGRHPPTRKRPALRRLLGLV